MAIDFTGGLSEDREYVFAEQPPIRRCASR